MVGNPICVQINWKENKDLTKREVKKKQKAKKRVVDPSLLGFSVTSSRIMQGEIELPGA